MKKLRLLDSTGDTVLDFDPKLADAAATKEAKALFDRMTKKGAAVYNVKPGETAERVKNFADVGEEAIIIPVIVGG